MKPIYVKRAISLKERVFNAAFYFGLSVFILGFIAVIGVILRWAFN